MSKPLMGEYLDFSVISLEIKNDIQWISLGVIFDLIFKVWDITHHDIQYFDIHKLC
jgi:hypothetical protein